jgi:hypothetical protein
MILLGLGIVLLVMSGIPFFVAVKGGSIVGIVGAVVCTGVIPIPMIVGGIASIRSAEDNASRQIEDPRSLAEMSKDPVGNVLARSGGLDLNRLNWIGWLLLFATFGFVVGEVVVLTILLGEGIWAIKGRARLVALAGLLVAIGFFAGVRWLLRALGITIYRW